VARAEDAGVGAPTVLAAACSPTARAAARLSRGPRSSPFAESDGDRLVGVQIAKRQAITNPQNTVFAVKRLIGRKFEDPNVQRAREVLPYPLVEAPNGDVKIQIRDRAATAPRRSRR
jgi:molecular chaperone DnaK